MFKNPLRKYQQGGSTTTSEQEQQIMAIFQSASKNTGIAVETLVEGLNQIQDETEKQGVAEAITRAAKGDASAIGILKKKFAKKATSAFEKGGKILDFICKHAKGGITGCGCQKAEVEKHQQKDNKGRGKINTVGGNPVLGSLNFVEREYDPEGNAIYTMARTREDLPSIMRSDPFSEYSQTIGEYQGNGQMRIVDFGNGRTRIIKNPYGPMNADVQHGQDSVAALEQLRYLAQKAGITLGPAIRKQGGEIKKEPANVEKAQNGKSKLGDSKKEEDGQTVKQNLEKAKKTSDAIKESHKTSDSGWKYNWAWERILNGRNGKWLNGTIQEIYHTGVNGVHGTLDTRGRDSLLTGYPVLRTIGKQDVVNGEPGWDLARDKWFEILRSNRTTPYAESMQNNLDRERINHPKPKKDEQGGQVEKAQGGKGRLGKSSIVFPSNTSRISYSFQPVISADPIIDSLAINAPNYEYETVRWNTGPDSYRYFTMPVNRNGYFRYHDDDYIGWPDTYGLDVKEARKPGFWKSFVWGRNVYPVDSETYRKVDSLITANRSPEVQKHIEEGKAKSKKKNK